MVKALGCGPRYLSSILSVHTMPACANWYSGLPQNQVFQSSSLWAGTKVMALQLSRQSRGLKILVSVVRFHPKPPYALVAEQADVLVLETSLRVQVQVLPGAPYIGVAELADATDLKSVEQRCSYGFKSHHRYQWLCSSIGQSSGFIPHRLQVRFLSQPPI